MSSEDQGAHQKSRGRGQPQPLRVGAATGYGGIRGGGGSRHSHSGSTQNSPSHPTGGQQQHEAHPHPLHDDPDFIQQTHQPYPPGSPASARPHTHQSTRSGRSTRSARGTPKKEQTVVGVGTYGLGDKGKALRMQMREDVFNDWCQKKKDQKASKKNSDQSEVRPVSPQDRVQYRKNQLALREYEKEMRNRDMAEEFREQRRRFDSDVKQQRSDDRQFVKNFSSDNVAECRDQLKKRESYLQQLESLKLPALEPFIKETKEEKQMWEKQHFEEDYIHNHNTQNKRYYILAMKQNGEDNKRAAKEAKMAEVRRQREWLAEKEAERKRARDEETGKKVVDAKEAKQKKRVDLYNAMRANRDRIEKDVEYVKMNDLPIREAIQNDREQAEAEKREEVKNRVAQRRVPRGKDFYFEGCRAGWFEERRAYAADIRAETFKNEKAVREEKEELGVSKKQLHNEGLSSARMRQEKIRSRPGSQSPHREQHGGY